MNPQVKLLARIHPIINISFFESILVPTWLSDPKNHHPLQIPQSALQTYQ